MAKKRQIYMAGLDAGQPNTELNDNKNFIESFQIAILLSLLDNETLTKWQFELCIDKLKIN